MSVIYSSDDEEDLGEEGLSGDEVVDTPEDNPGVVVVDEAGMITVVQSPVSTANVIPERFRPTPERRRRRREQWQPIVIEDSDDKEEEEEEDQSDGGMVIENNDARSRSLISASSSTRARAMTPSSPKIIRNVAGIKGLHVLLDAFDEAVEERLFASNTLFPSGPDYYKKSKRQGGQVHQLGGSRDYPEDLVRLANVVRDTRLYEGYVTPDYCLPLVHPTKASFKVSSRRSCHRIIATRRDVFFVHCDV